MGLSSQDWDPDWTATQASQGDGDHDGETEGDGDSDGELEAEVSDRSGSDEDDSGDEHEHTRGRARARGGARASGSHSGGGGEGGGHGGVYRVTSSRSSASGSSGGKTCATCERAIDSKLCIEFTRTRDVRVFVCALCVLIVCLQKEKMHYHPQCVHPGLRASQFVGFDALGADEQAIMQALFD